jgi:DNA-binding NarL/FixJ family response regulator
VTTLIIVHAVSLFRDGLRLSLSARPEFTVVGEASNGQQAIQLVDQADPDLVLMDIDLPGVNGLEVARVIKRSHPHVAVVLFGPVNDGASVVKAIRAGVSACVPPNVEFVDLLETLQQVRRGEYPINDLVLSSPEVAATVLEAFRQMVGDDEIQAVFSPLSTRELEVLELVIGHQQSDGQKPHLVDFAETGSERSHAGGCLCTSTGLDQSYAAK